MENLFDIKEEPQISIPRVMQNELTKLKEVLSAIEDLSIFREGMRNYFDLCKILIAGEVGSEVDQVYEALERDSITAKSCSKTI